METTILPAGTTPEILAPYLPYGIPLQTPFDNPRTLSGLQMGDGPCAACKSAEGWESWLGLEYIKPILRSFSQLVEPLADGTVPAVEVAKMALADCFDELDWTKATVDQYHWCAAISVPAQSDVRWVYSCTIDEEWEIKTGDNLSCSIAIIDYLRRHHFAVGMEPHQYIEKQ
ncbi:hypothetical protein [Hymenobacter properus]|uniref:Uncharacterized protein n=1 Tax=Hymenobacter properus TaxID=2791026 RepID=A0A931BGG5_9BACT|nr:hypothetical protein [Hymenobacter properus]MBF9140812.1 hypothetical protein [Hymenobacter properus]MBR7719621.1 hypothetical protein [Microvirga sp. SRT04]